MLSILLATHNFYPYYQGGTEVYVLNLAKHLQKLGHQVAVISAMDEIQFTNQNTIFEDLNIRICNYTYEDISVYGVLTENISTIHIYSKYSEPHIESYYSFFTDKYFDLLHIHGFTATIGLDLIYAVKKAGSAIKVITSYHTPISDPKETLTFSNTLTEIHYPLNHVADLLSYRLNLPYSFASSMVKLLPKFYLKVLPAIFNIKYLVKLSVESFSKLVDLTDEWWVYSEGIRKHLIEIGIDSSKIRFERHGVSSEFIGNVNLATKPTKFLFSGRMLKIKGFHTLIKAWSGLTENNEKELWITGKPESDDMFISKFIKKVISRNDIRWLGQLNQKQLAEIYAQVNWVIIPSECYETGPLVFHEAIAGGCSVIASDIGGCKELAAHYHNFSTTFETGNSIDLKLKIAQNLGLNRTHFKEVKVLSFYQHFSAILQQSTILTDNN